MSTESQILDSMRGIIDPDLGKDIVSLGFIKDLQIDGGKVSFTVELTTPACPVKDQFKTQCEDAVGALPDVESVIVSFSAMAPKNREGQPNSSLEKVDAAIAVSSCKGGVGKSTIAAQLARSLQREGLRVGLLDTDIYGPSVPTLFNLHRPQLVMRENMLVPLEVDGLKLMSLGFVLGDQPAVMRGPMVSGYVQQILHQTDWGELDYLIIDMPPGTGDIQLTLVQQASLEGALIVTTPHSLSLVDVARGIVMFEKVNVPVLGIVENMAYFVCDNCDKQHFIFGSSAQTLKDRFGLPTLATFPILENFSNLEGGGTDAPLEPLAQLTENLHRAVGMRRAQGDQKPVVTAQPGHIHIQWPDGSEDLLANAEVRGSCQCAQCIEEFTGNQLLDVKSIPADIKANTIDTLGNYAVVIGWSDGHSSGIFSWDHLKHLAQKAGA